MFRVLATSLSLCAVASCPSQSMEAAIRSFGYSPLHHGADWAVPGTVVSMHPDGGGSVRIVCTSARALGADFAPQELDVSGSALQAAKGTLPAVALDVERLNLPQHVLNAVEGITMTLTHGQVYGVGDAPIEALRDAVATSHGCIEAARARMAQGWIVTIIDSAVMADAHYTVQWRKGVSGDEAAKHRALMVLAEWLDARVLDGDGLEKLGVYWGFRDDGHVAGRYLNPFLRPHERFMVAKGTPLFP